MEIVNDSLPMQFKGIFLSSKNEKNIGKILIFSIFLFKT